MAKLNINSTLPMLERDLQTLQKLEMALNTAVLLADITGLQKVLAVTIEVVEHQIAAERYKRTQIDIYGPANKKQI